MVATVALGLATALPLLCNLHLTYAWSYPKLFALQTATLAAWVGLLLVRPASVGAMLSASGLGVPMLFLLAWSGLSTAWSPAPWAAIRPLVEMSTLALAVVAFANLLGRPRVRRWFSATYGASAAVACVAFALLFEGPARNIGAYPFANPNLAAGFAIIPMSVGLAYALAAMWRRVRPRAGMLGAVVAGAGAAAILASGSAAGRVAAGGAVVLVLLFSFGGRFRWRGLLVLAGLGAIGLVALVWHPESRAWMTRELGARPIIWRASGRLAAEHPLRGLGVGSFVVEFSRVHPAELSAHEHRSDVVHTAHSLPLHVLVELGIVGLAAAGWLALAAARNARKAARRISESEAPLLVGAVCGGAGMLAHGLVAVALHHTGCHINLVLVLALLGGMARSRGQEARPHVRRPGWASALLCAALVGLYVLTAGPGLVSQVYMRRGRMAGPSTPVRQAIRDLERAVSTTWPTFWTIEARIELAKHRWALRHVEAAVEQLETADRLAPNLGKLRRLRARLYLQLGRTGAAAKDLASYARKDPFDETTYEHWAATLDRALGEGRPEAAQPDQAVRLLELAERRDTDRLPKERARELKARFLKGLPLSPEPAVTPPPHPAP